MSTTRATRRRTAKTRARRKVSAGSPQRWHEAVVVDQARLLARPNVERVELGWKERKGRVTSRMAVKIYVIDKKRVVPLEEQFPKWAHVLVPIGKDLFKRRRVPTDVVWHAPAKFIAAPGDFLNPVPGGGMIGVPGRQFGTYACLAANAAGQTFALTAGHVVQGLQGNVVPGAQILQPPAPAAMPPGASPLFGVTTGGFFGNTPQGFLDVALLRLSPQRAATTDTIDNVTVLRQVVPAAVVINNRVPCTKFGAATGRTAAAFSALVSSMMIGGIPVTNVLEFVGVPGGIFAAAGDSGALVVSAIPGTLPVVIGILFAATDPTPDAPAGRGYVIPFERIPALRPF